MTTIEAKKRRKNKLPYSAATYTTGDIALNINRFNQAFGTTEGGEAGIGGEGALCEAKRYVRRYYFRPMNKFASNKAEVLKMLIEIGDQNCTIYTLNNLGDEKDVSKLTSNDIIYTYDDGILKDKNGIRIMDYDLSIKKEEERKKFANVDATSDKEFKAEYEDRMTYATELEEALTLDTFEDCGYDVVDAGYDKNGELVVTLNHSVHNIEYAAEDIMYCLERQGIHTIDWNTNGNNVFIFTLAPDNAFDMDFDDVNAYGEKLTEAKENFCCICGEPIEGYGNNPEPYMSADEGRCCDSCNVRFVIPARLEMMED